MNAAITARPDAAAWLSALHARAVDRLKGAADRVLLQSCSLHLAAVGGWPVFELQTAEGRPLEHELQKGYGAALAAVLADAGAGLTVLNPPSPESPDAAAGLAGLWSRALNRIGPSVLPPLLRLQCRLVSVDALTASLRVPDQGSLGIVERNRVAIEQALAEVLGQRVALVLVVAERNVGEQKGTSAPRQVNSDATPEG